MRLLAEITSALETNVSGGSFSSPTTATASQRAQIKRLREILFDSKSEYYKTLSRNKERRERSLLMREATKQHTKDEERNAQEQLLQERVKPCSCTHCVSCFYDSSRLGTHKMQQRAC